MYSMLMFLLMIYQFQIMFASQAVPEKYTKKKNESEDFNMFQHPGQWPVDDRTMKKWQDWYKNWLDEQDKLRKQDKELIKEGWTDYDHESKPRKWTRLPPGSDHQEPPPWAIIPNSYGKPDFCYQRPERGDCNALVKRWGFNQDTGRCQTFEYSGCGGNDNNFLNLWRCEEACLKLASSLCLNYGKRRDGVALQGRPGC